MYCWGSQDLFEATHFFTAGGFQRVFLRYNFAGLLETCWEEAFEISCVYIDWSDLRTILAFEFEDRNEEYEVGHGDS